MWPLIGLVLGLLIVWLVTKEPWQPKMPHVKHSKPVFMSGICPQCGRPTGRVHALRHLIEGGVSQ
jgi:hypothetical protein